MEEPLFENETPLDRKLVKEAIDATYGISNRGTRIFWATVSVALLLLGGYLVYLKIYIPAYVLLVIGVVQLIAAFQPHGPGKSYRSMLALNPSGQSHFLFYGDHFEHVTPVSRATLAYANVTKVIDTKHTYTLLFGLSCTVLSKTGFQKSSDLDVGAFLRQKCGSAKFYRK